MDGRTREGLPLHSKEHDNISKWDAQRRQFKMDKVVLGRRRVGCRHANTGSAFVFSPGGPQ